jgi:Lon protease-like protein
MDDMTQVIELPLFPLKTVLFPGQMLPLHIFEQRYQTMIRRCLAEDSPFGVVLIREGEEVGEVTAEPHSVGTVTRIIESTHLPDGTMNIVGVGTERFRIRQLLHDQPYLRGQVETFPMPAPFDPARVNQLVQAVQQRVTRYIQLIAEAAGLKIEVDNAPETPQQVGYLAAMAMQIDNAEKQSLLVSDSLDKILAAEIILLNRENALLKWMAGSKEWPGQVQFGPSGTLLPN